MMDTPIRLTQPAKRAGCAAKQPPGYLFPLLSALPAITDPNVLVGDVKYRLVIDTASLK